LQFQNLTEAEAKGDLGPGVSLVELVQGDKLAAAAWERGQLMRALLMVAATATTMTEAALWMTQRGFGPFLSGKDLRAAIDSDKEIKNLWNQHRLATKISTRKGIIAAAIEGNQWAIQAADRFLRDLDEDGVTRKIEWNVILLTQVVELMGVTRQAVWNYRDHAGMPCMGSGPTGKVDLKKWLPWYTEFLTKKVGGQKSVTTVSPLQDRKVRQMDLDYRLAMGQVVEDGAFIGWTTSALQSIVTAFADLPEIANGMFGQSREEIVRSLQALQDSLMGRLQQVPEELHLSEVAKSKLLEFYGTIKQEREVANGK